MQRRDKSETRIVLPVNEKKIKPKQNLASETEYTQVYMTPLFKIVLVFSFSYLTGLMMLTLQFTEPDCFKYMNKENVFT